MTESDEKWYETEMSRAKWQEAQRKEREDHARKLGRKIDRRAKIRSVLEILYWAFLAGWILWLVWTLIQGFLQQWACEDTCNSMGTWNDVCLCLEEDGKSVYMRAPDDR